MYAISTLSLQLSGRSNKYTSCFQEYSHEMRIVNSDGAEPQMCGNGIRCLALYLVAHRGVAPNSEICFRTRAGKIVAVVNERLCACPTECWLSLSPNPFFFFAQSNICIGKYGSPSGISHCCADAAGAGSTSRARPGSAGVGQDILRVCRVDGKPTHGQSEDCIETDICAQFTLI